jgi:hypothetical protein
MLGRYETGLNPEELMVKWGLRYSPPLEPPPPDLRHVPLAALPQPLAGPSLGVASEQAAATPQVQPAESFESQELNVEEYVDEMSHPTSDTRAFTSAAWPGEQFQRLDWQQPAVSVGTWGQQEQSSTGKTTWHPTNSR